MRVLAVRAMALALLCAALPSVAPAWAQSAPNNAPADETSVFLADIGRDYDSADGPALTNNPVARLAIYQRVMRRMDDAPASIRETPRYRRNRLFYAVAVATTLTDAGDPQRSEREIDALLPQVRAYVGATSTDLTMVDALVRLLRGKGQLRQVANNLSVALPLFREAVPLTQALIDANSFPNRAYGERSLAIDLDNLANLEAQAGNIAEANDASARALSLFRQLAAQDPDSRPAQGSLLIALLRRGLNFNEVERLDEAERQIAVMRGRGQLIDRYATVAEQLPSLRAGLVARQRGGT